MQSPHDHFATGFLTLSHIGSTIQLADLFTKALTPARFEFVRVKLHLSSRSTCHLRGECQELEERSTNVGCSANKGNGAGRKKRLKDEDVSPG